MGSNTVLRMAQILLGLAKNRIGHQFMDFNDNENEESVEGKIVVITGANSGLGKVVCREMIRRKATVVMACRDLAKADNVASEIKESIPTAKLHLLKLDLCSLESVRHCAIQIMEKFPHVNILINNAGYYGADEFLERTKDGHEKNLAANHLGHFLLTLLLLNHLKAGEPSRVVCVSSINYTYSTPEPGNLNYEKEYELGSLNLFPYANAKHCVMLFAKELARRLEGTQVRTYSLCPGLVRTPLYDDFPWLLRKIHHNFFIPLVGLTPEQGAETTMYCALSHVCSQESGKTYRFARYWPEAEANMSEELAGRVWVASEKLVGFKFEEVNTAGFETNFLHRHKKSNEVGQGQKVIPMILGRAKNKVGPLESIYVNDRLDLFV